MGFLLSACKNRVHRNSQPLRQVQTNPLPRQTIMLTGEQKAELKTNNPFSIVYLNTNGRDCFFAIDNKSNLVGYSNTLPFDSKKKQVLRAVGSSNVILCAHAPYLYVYDYITKNCSELVFRENTLLTSDSAKIGNCMNSKTYYYMDEQNNKVFKTKYGLTLTGNYGLWKKSNKNYLDTSLLLLSFQNGQIKMFNYPKNFYRDYINNRKCYFDTDGENNWYYAFEDGTNIYKSDSTGQIEKTVNCNYYSLSSYDEDKKKDLSYTRTYNANNERNSDLTLIMDKYIILLKKMPQQKITDRETSFYNVYNTKLDLLYSDSISDNLFPRIFENGDGFYFIDNSISKIFLVKLPQ